MVDVGYDYDYRIVNKLAIMIKIMIMMMVIIIIGLWMDVGMDQQGFVRQTWSVLRRQCVELPDTRTLSDGGGKHTLPYFQCPYQQAAATRTTLGADCSFGEWELDGVGGWELPPLELTRSRRGNEVVMKPYLGPIRCMYIIYMFISFIYRSRCIYILHVPLMDYKL